jgi:hypothetical protein
MPHSIKKLAPFVTYVVEFEPGQETADGVALALVLDVEEVLLVVEPVDIVLELARDEEEIEPVVTVVGEEVLELVVIEDALDDVVEEPVMSLAPHTPLLTGAPTEDLR